MELPEITILSKQMDNQITGRTIHAVEIGNDKCLNVPLEEFKEKTEGAKITSVRPRGKWVIIGLDNGHTILFNTGMGADVLRYASGETLPEKYSINIVFDDGSGFTVRVWWFCYLHLKPDDRIHEHKQVGNLGVSPLESEFTMDYFRGMLEGRRGGVKSFLMNQRNIAGIGNVYIQDILFDAGIHPNRKINTLTPDQIEALYYSIKKNLEHSIKLGGLQYEKDFYGKHGSYSKDQFRVAYKEGQPCPECGTTIQKIKTGSTSGYICPHCQKV